ncbi:MAG: antitoxin Xre/MbcA/ParS toxin-binding domain-containing protein [Daejeonella sp.]
MKKLIVNEPAISYQTLGNRNILSLINAVREGIKFNAFMSIVTKSPFNISEWSAFLHLSERTMQRYKKEEKTFDPIHSEKILEITLIYKKGVDVFGDTERFNSWLNSTNIALGNIKPKDLLDNTFGISMLKDELTRIEYGVLA